ncbi:MAG: nucleotide exchange factor GrpE [Clostridiales bacterium]|nr:nucleotide exchange factor GrpE [Candidatus Crickella equi]
MAEDKKMNEEFAAEAETEKEKTEAEKKEAEAATDDVKADEAKAESGDIPESEESQGSDEAQESESEKYIRLLAEFQNFKKRAAKEKTDIHAYANEKLMSELLPVLDNFERALETKTEEVESYAKGMELIFTQMKTALENHGLKEIVALGENFDPNKHSAVMTEESDEYESGKVSKVLQKGYELNGRVIRPAMVAVTK